jgi:hypothetical protein
MSENKVEWPWYIPLSIIGFLFAVLLIGAFNMEWLVQPLNLPPWNRLSLLFFSLFGGTLFFGMIQFGYYVWKGSLFIVDKIHSVISQQLRNLDPSVSTGADELKTAKSGITASPPQEEAEKENKK